MQEQSVLVPRRLLLGLQRRAWQLAFVPEDRAVRLCASLGSRVTHRWLPNPPVGSKLRSSKQGTGTQSRYPQEGKGREASPRTVSRRSYRDELLWAVSACPLVALDYCVRDLAAEVPVSHVQFTSPFVTPIFQGMISQHLAKGPLPS